ncbi:hypothetical protein Lesp02_45560 [Lentzea sp. NBRC 105346]|uniref:DMT family transporter n=1 Tax=Lentzea sp. NBRC 105346 TaxID=3032205 RepID=UPI0024A49569|nr:EamA family transporter [Lentzea sp. NBRC 105346]GLZ32368.1 hypothetical protein Lesp02_45560 [Lentzea sp. NBRC 105346]
MAERVALASFTASAVLAGANGVGIRFSNRELDPLWGAGLRFTLAAALFVALMVALRLRLPRGRALAGAAIFGVLNIGVAYALAYYALLHMHAGLGQTLLALVPLLTLLLAVAQRQERLRLAAVAGTVLALAGVAVLGRASLGGVPGTALVAAIASAVCIAQAAVTVRRFPQVHPVVVNAVGMTVGAILLLVASFAARENQTIPAKAETWTALAYLVVVGSVVVFGLYLVVLKHWAASRTAYVFVIAPFVTIALSVWLDDEPVGPALAIGGVLVLAGVYVGALRTAVT